MGRLVVGVRLAHLDEVRDAGYVPKKYASTIHRRRLDPVVSVRMCIFQFSVKYAAGNSHVYRAGFAEIISGGIDNEGRTFQDHVRTTHITCPAWCAQPGNTLANMECRMCRATG
jgi:hypothetical protein